MKVTEKIEKFLDEKTKMKLKKFIDPSIQKALNIDSLTQKKLIDFFKEMGVEGKNMIYKMLDPWAKGTYFGVKNSDGSWIVISPVSGQSKNMSSTIIKKTRATGIEYKKEGLYKPEYKSPVEEPTKKSPGILWMGKELPGNKTGSRNTAESDDPLGTEYLQEVRKESKEEE